jgi:polysaccharide biosynthesis PFTS motif protein
MIPEYFDYLYMLIEKKRLTVLPLTHNIAEIISSTDCLIAHPFSTSTKYAHHIGKTGVHYDPTGRVLDDPYDGGETILLSGRNDLERFIEKFYE